MQQKGVLFPRKAPLLPYDSEKIYKPPAPLSQFHIVAHQRLKQIVPIHLADDAAGIFIGCDVGRVLRQDLAHQLIDGVVALFFQRVVHFLHSSADLFVLIVVNGKNRSFVRHCAAPPFAPGTARRAPAAPPDSAFRRPLQGPLKFAFIIHKIPSACNRIYVSKVQNCGNPVPFHKFFAFAGLWPGVGNCRPGMVQWHKGSGAAAADQANQEESCMIVGIGTDLCRISRMEKALASPAFFHRVFGPEEQALLERRTGAGRLATAAANFAAKEAFLKAAGVGLGGFSLGDIQVLRQESGAPFYHLSGTAAAFAQKLTLHLTLSHEGEYALAFALFEAAGH